MPLGPTEAVDLRRFAVDDQLLTGPAHTVASHEIYRHFRLNDGNPYSTAMNWGSGVMYTSGVDVCFVMRLHNYRSTMAATYVASGSITPAPGEAVTIDVVERNKRFRAALSLISDFERDGLDAGEGEPRKISSETAKTAKDLLRSLGASSELPRMAPDDEGSLVMVWEHKQAPVLIVVDGNRLHLAENATTPKVTYTNDLAFDGYVLPREITNALR